MLSRRRTYMNTILLSAFCILSLLLAACGDAGSVNKDSPLLVDTGPTGDYTRNFNPFSGSPLAPTDGSIYEPLLYINMVTGAISPWLAKSYQLTADTNGVTFILQDGVKWSDGKPLTAKDVVFTFNLMKKFPGLDTNGVWTYLKDVTAKDDKTAVLTFKNPNASLLFYLGTKTYIVPEHLWSSVSDPVKYANPDPVGSGPYVLKSFSSQNITIVKNPQYWQPGKPEVKEVQFPASNDNAGIELRLYSNKVDWTGIPARNVQKLYVDKDPKNHHYWFVPVDFSAFFVNHTVYPLNLLPVRQAISDALDREQMSKIAEQGYEPVAHPTGIIPSQKDKYMKSEYANLTFTHDVVKAQRTLESAGFTKDSQGIYLDKNGKKLSFTISVVAGWSDWESICQIAAQNLKDAGFDVTVKTYGVGDFQSRIANGQFDLAIGATAQGPSPYYAYNNLLNSANTAPVGQPAAGDVSRWKDGQTDALLRQYTTTIDPTKQREALYGLQKIMVEQLPAIPLLYDVTWAEYNSSKVTGWPDPSNPYAPPGNYYNPDLGYILLHLKPVK